MIRIIRISLLCAACALWLFAGLSARAEDVPTSSLFFTPDEARQIDALAAKKAPDPAHPDIHLGAVMYYGPDDWTLWLEGERWTPSTQHADLRVLDVQPGEVHLSLVTAIDPLPREIVLHPNQTYQIATGKIVEGAQ